MPFSMQKRAIGLKLETTPFTAETLTSSDYDFRAFNVSYTPEIEAVARNYATGDYSAFSSIMGKRSMTVTFSVHMNYSGTVTTAPEWGKLLQACGFSETVLASGVRYLPDSSQCAVPATIEVQEEGCGSQDALILICSGAQGNVTFIMNNVGEPVQMDFEFTGVLYDVKDRANGSIINPGGFDSSEPEAVLGSTITVFGEAATVNSVNATLGNAVELFVDPAQTSGYRGAYITGREATISLDPYLEPIATNDHFGRWSGGTTGAFSMTVGSNLTISAPAVQITTAYAAADRNGISVNGIEGILTRGATGDDELKILQGSE